MYDITRNDSVLDNYSDSGIIGYIFSQTEQKSDDGYYVVDGIGYWLCTPPSQNNQIGGNASCNILSDSDELFIGLDPEVFTAIFYDENGIILNGDRIPSFSFSIEFDYPDKLISDIVGNSILISTNDHGLNNKSFKLILSAEGYNKIDKIIRIKEFL